MNKYFSSNTSVTLGEAIRRLRLSEGENDATDKMLVEAKKVFEQHDAVHILFNCGTSIRDEIAVHVWMVFATTANVGEMHRAVASQEHRNVMTDIGHFRLVRIWIRSLPHILNIIYKSWRMKQRLPLEELHNLKKLPVLKIRQEYGIVL